MATASAAGILAVVGAAPALAQPIDYVSIDTSKVDFGNSWANQAPTSGAPLDWDTGNGNTCLDGNIYLKNANGVTAQIYLEIYDDTVHTPGELPLATTKSKKKTAVGNALNTFPVDVPCQNSPGTHAHVVLFDDSSNPGGGLTEQRTVYANE